MKTLNENAKCETCPYWQQLGQEFYGYCRRFPPMLMSDARCAVSGSSGTYFAANYSFPRTDDKQVCGEHPDFFKPRGLAMSDWISCKERLPRKHKIVWAYLAGWVKKPPTTLVCLEGTRCHRTWHPITGPDRDLGLVGLYEVSHWAELEYPEPPNA